MQYKQGGYIEESRPDVVLGEVAPLSRALRNKPNQLLRALAGEEQGRLNLVYSLPESTKIWSLIPLYTLLEYKSIF